MGTDPWKAYLARFPDPEFGSYARGAISPRLALELRDHILAAPLRPLSPEDRDPAAAWNMIRAGELRRLNEQQRYREPLDDALAIALLEELRAPVALAMGTPWRVLNMRPWTTPPSADMGPCKWHTDGDLHKFAKIMVYLTDCGEGLGGLEMEAHGAVVTVKGRAGQWCVFRNSVVRHRGMPPAKGERVAVEITIAPADEFDLQPRFLGHIARYPLEP